MRKNGSEYSRCAAIAVTLTATISTTAKIAWFAGIGRIATAFITMTRNNPMEGDSMDKRITEAEELLREFLEAHLAQCPKCTCMLPTKYARYIKQYYPEQFHGITPDAMFQGNYARSGETEHG